MWSGVDNRGPGQQRFELRSCRAARGRLEARQVDGLDGVHHQDARAQRLHVREDDVAMGHEATVSKVSDDQLFYLMSRGLSEDEAMAMIVRGFVEPIARELPMEYALELNRLIELQMEGAVG